MEIEFLGTGTSFGVPEIGCNCDVCGSTDPHDKRLRSSLLIRLEDHTIVIDTGPDFRQQCLRAEIDHLDAVLITHMHADHIYGLDDVRKFNYLQKAEIPVYVPEQFIARFSSIFDYALQPAAPGLTRPRFALEAVEADHRIQFAGLTITPVEVDHGSQTIIGYHLDSGSSRVAYLTDCKQLTPAGIEVVRGADIIVLGALWDREWSHPGHLNLEEALTMGQELEAGAVYFTHITHYMGLAADINPRIASQAQLAHDGLRITLP